MRVDVRKARPRRVELGARLRELCLGTPVSGDAVGADTVASRAANFSIGAIIGLAIWSLPAQVKETHLADKFDVLTKGDQKRAEIVARQAAREDAEREARRVAGPQTRAPKRRTNWATSAPVKPARVGRPPKPNGNPGP